MTSWVITIPKKIPWAEYQRELAVAAAGGVLNYHTRHFPKEMRSGDRCYVVHDGRVRGWMTIVGLVHFPYPWTCTSTGTRWPPGKYIQRSGVFTPTNGPEMMGFRGVRLYAPDSTLVMSRASL